MANFYFFIKILMHYSRKKNKQTGRGGEEGISRGKERTCESSKGQLKKK